VQEQADDDVPEGRVISSSPSAGTRVERGSPVTLFVSTGPEQVAVPEVVGLAEDEAKRTLAENGLTWEAVDEGSDEADPGTVLRQSPTFGSEIDPGSAVTLVVAREIPQVTVPDVRGQTAEDATRTLLDAGLEPRESTSPVNDPAQDGLVIGQRPAGGTTANEGAPVRIFVGRFVSPPPDSGADG
jgi:beta-lactam-binding protein with PASTA domain